MRDRPVARRRILEAAGRGVRARVRVRIAEHDDIAAVRMPETVRQLVDEDPVPLPQRRLHRCGRDVERLHQERFDQQRDPERERDEDRELFEEPEGTAAVFWGWWGLGW